MRRDKGYNFTQIQSNFNGRTIARALAGEKSRASHATRVLRATHASLAPSSHAILALVWPEPEIGSRGGLSRSSEHARLHFGQTRSIVDKHLLILGKRWVLRSPSGGRLENLPWNCPSPPPKWRLRTTCPFLHPKLKKFLPRVFPNLNPSRSSSKPRLLHRLA